MPSISSPALLATKNAAGTTIVQANHAIRFVGATVAVDSPGQTVVTVTGSPDVTAWHKAGDVVVGGDVFGSTNNIDVQMIRNSVITCTIIANGLMIMSKNVVELTVDPSAGGGIVAPIGSIGMRNNAGAGETWQKYAAANTAWAKFITTVDGAAWVTAGNSLNGGGPTTPVQQFGSTNDFDVVFIRNNIESMRLSTAACFRHGVLTAGGAFNLSGSGAQVHGIANGAGSVINATSDGATAFGSSITGGTIQATNQGTLAFGVTATNGFVEAITGGGSIAHGVSVGAGSRITAGGAGAQAFGETLGGGRIISSGTGSLCFGDAESTSFMTSSNSGSIAHGEAAGGGTITASGPGTIAGGFFSQASGTISASAFGGIAHGYCNGNSSIQVTANAAFAMGASLATFTILASGEGSFSFGHATLRNNTASGIDSTAHGDSNIVAGNLATALGLGHTNPVYGSLLIGRFGLLAGTSASWVATEAVFAVGNGTAIGAEAIGYQIDKDGRQTTTASHVDTGIRSINAAAAISARSDYAVVCDTTGASGNLTLPAGEKGLEFVFTGSGAGGAVYTLVAAGGDLFDVNVVTAISSGVICRIKFLAGTWYAV